MGCCLEAQNESQYSTALDKIFAQLHQADEQTERTSQNTLRLAMETKSMLNDLGKQLG
ncbi:MAG: hypothetical protein AAF652_16345 [Cyanobacteria bacterium P01_C01_bin.72]